MTKSLGKSIIQLYQSDVANIRDVLTERPIAEEIFEHVCTLVPPKPPNSFVLGEELISYLENLLLYEEAYELIETTVLNFTSQFMERIGRQSINGTKRSKRASYLDLPVWPAHCYHYDECIADIYVDHRHETSAQIDDTRIRLDQRWSQQKLGQLIGAKAHVNVIRTNRLVSEGHQGLNMLSLIATRLHSTERYSIVERMFNLAAIPRSSIPASNTCEITHPYLGDAIRMRALRKAFDARAWSWSSRPFIVCVYNWIEEITWIDSLIKNSKSCFRIGILCPYDRTVHKLKLHLGETYKNVSISTSQPNGLSRDLDCLILYQAHSIGVTEAIYSMTKVKTGGSILLIGDPHMPNLRVRNYTIRDACGSIMQWFYNKDRYPEYFDSDSPFVAHVTICAGYDPIMLDLLSKLVYGGRRLRSINLSSGQVSEELEAIPAVWFNKHRIFGGRVKVDGCSAFNEAEAEACVSCVEWLVSEASAMQVGQKGAKIGVLTTYCAQKRRIRDKLRGTYDDVFVGILDEYQNKVCDYLIISTVETSERHSGGLRRYPFSDLLYDRRCFELALTRGARRIFIYGDKKVLNQFDHWEQLLLICWKTDPRGTVFAVDTEGNIHKVHMTDFC